MLILSEKKKISTNQPTKKQNNNKKKKTRKHYGTYTNVRLVNWTEIEFLKILD